MPYLAYLKSYGGPDADPFTQEPYLKLVGGVFASSTSEALSIARRNVPVRNWETVEVKRAVTVRECVKARELEQRRQLEFAEFLWLVDPLS